MEHLGPQGRWLCAVGTDEVVEQVRGRVLKQAVPECLEALDDFFDQRPGSCTVAAPFLGGGTAVLLQVAHPLVAADVAGLWDA